MLICHNCFSDTEIKSIIKSLNKRSKCDICGKLDYCIDSETDLEEWAQIKDYLFQILEIYSSEDILPKDFPTEKMYTVSYLFSSRWRILNSDLNKNQTVRILKTFGIDFNENKKIGNRLLLDKDYLRKNSILRDSTWNDFLQALKYKNRFHLKYFNEEILTSFFRCFQTNIPKNSEYVRGRISRSEKGFSLNELEAPPKEKATAGRANAERISRLYLADSKDTVLKEVRAGIFDFVSIAKFTTEKELSVVDFTALDIYSPFPMEIDMSVLDINRDNLENLNKELGRPMRRTDNLLDYVPTQYLVDFIESIRDKTTGKKLYDGVMYKSVMNPGGINLVAFDKSAFKIQPNIITIKIKSITYNC